MCPVAHVGIAPRPSWPTAAPCCQCEGFFSCRRRNDERFWILTDAAATTRKDPKVQDLGEHLRRSHSSSISKDPETFCFVIPPPITRNGASTVSLLGHRTHYAMLCSVSTVGMSMSQHPAPRSPLRLLELVHPACVVEGWDPCSTASASEITAVQRTTRGSKHVPLAGNKKSPRVCWIHTSGRRCRTLKHFVVCAASNAEKLDQRSLVLATLASVGTVNGGVDLWHVEDGECSLAILSVVCSIFRLSRPGSACRTCED